MDRNQNEEIYSEKDIPHALTQITALSAAIQMEFELVTARMGWLLVSEAFIIAAYQGTVIYYSQIKEFSPFVVIWLLTGFPFVGIAILLIVHVAIRAAHNAASDSKDERTAMMKKLPENLRITLVSSRDVNHAFGNLPAQSIPWMFLAFWMGLLIATLSRVLNAKL